MFREKIASALSLIKNSRYGKVLTVVVALAVTACLLTSFVVLEMNTVVVYENGEEIKTFTSLKNEKEDLLKVAGLSVKTGDQVTLAENDGKLHLSVIRGMNVTVAHADEKINVVAYNGQTVEQVLEIAGVEYTEDDVLSVAADSEVVDGMVITVTRRVTKTIKETEIIDFETVVEETKDLFKGESEVAQQGKYGEKTLTYSVVYENGKEVSRKLVDTAVTKKAQDKIIRKGTKVKVEVTGKDGQKVDLSGARCITVTATAYCNTSDGGQYTCFGKIPSYGTVAVDPRVIPLGTKMYITSADGSYVYGYCVAGDTGGAIKGNRVDLFLGSESECRAFGRRQMQVYILD